MASKRRTFGVSSIAAAMAILGVGAAPCAEAKEYRIGVLMYDERAAQTPLMEAFLEELAKRGLVEGRNLRVERRYAKNFGEGLDSAARELVALKPDALYTACGFRCAQAAKRHTTTIPVVFDGAGDPVVQGLTNDLAKPTDNLTGTALFGAELDLKRFELLREAIGKGGLSFVMLQPPLSERARASYGDRLAAFDKANDARSQIIEVSGRDGLPAAFERMAGSRVDAVVVASSPLENLHCQDIVALAAKYRLPAIGGYEPCMDAGMLMVYALDFTEVYRQGGEYVYRILMGAKPAELPIVRASRFRLVVNQKTAKALGLTLPKSVLLRADKVIE